MSLFPSCITFFGWLQYAKKRQCESPFHLHKSVPSNKVKAFFQEGLEKNTEKGRRTDKMLYDRESISACFFVSAKEYAWWSALYQLFSCSILWSTSVSELITKLYKAPYRASPDTTKNNWCMGRQLRAEQKMANPFTLSVFPTTKRRFAMEKHTALLTKKTKVSQGRV